MATNNVSDYFDGLYYPLPISKHPVVDSKFFKKLSIPQRAIVDDLSMGSTIRVSWNGDRECGTVDRHYAKITHPKYRDNNYQAKYEKSKRNVGRALVRSLCNRPGAREWLTFGGTTLNDIGEIKIKYF